MSESNEEFGSLLSGTVIVFFGFVTQLGLVFLFRVTIARYLTVDGFGLVALFMAAINTIGLVSVAGLDVGVGRYVPRFDDVAKRGDIVRSAIEVAVPLSLFAAVSIYLASGWLATDVFNEPSLEPLFVVAAIATPFYGLQRLAIGAARGQEETVPKVLIENLLIPGSQLVLTLLVILLGYHMLGVAWAFAGGLVLAGLLGAIYLLKRTPIRMAARGSMHRELAVFSIPLVITGIMFNLIHYLDTFLLGYLSTASSVGIYNTVYPLSQLVTVFLSSFGFLFLPAISGLQSDGRIDRADDLAKLTAKWIFFLTFPVFALMFFFPEPTISLTFGAKYAPGALALSVLVFGFLVHSGFGPTGKGLVALGHTRLVMIDNVIAAAVNVALNIYLIPRFDFLGAAIASVIAFWTLDVLWLYQLHRHAGIVPVSGGLVRVAAISGGLSVICYTLISQQIGRHYPAIFGFLCLVGVLHLFVVFRYGGLTDEEIELIARAEAILGRDLSTVRHAVLYLRR